MADNKREHERAEMYKSNWGIANDLCGSVDGIFRVCLGDYKKKSVQKEQWIWQTEY